MSASSWCNLPVYTSLVLEIGALCYHLLFLYGAVYLTWDVVDAGQVLYHIPSLLFSLRFLWSGYLISDSNKKMVTRSGDIAVLNPTVISH